LALVSATGLGAIIMASPTVFLLIKYIGIGYLLYIGQAIWRSKGSWALPLKTAAEIPSGFALFRKSFVLGLSNPKALVFFSALFPQFIQINDPLLPQFLLLAGTSLSNAFIFTFGYALVAFKFKQRLLPAINSGKVSKLTGGLFIGFAGVLGFSH